jgi:hypothetical protein
LWGSLVRIDVFGAYGSAPFKDIRFCLISGDLDRDLKLENIVRRRIRARVLEVQHATLTAFRVINAKVAV